KNMDNWLRGLRPAVVALACALGAQAAAAQPATGALVGTVTGDAGNRLSGVTVTVHNLLTGEQRTATTGADGRYEIQDLTTEGTYQVDVALAGFATAASENVALVPNTTLVVNFRLKLSVAESVAVTGRSPQIDTGLSAVQQTVNEQLVHTLPLVGRNFIPLAM